MGDLSSMFASLGGGINTSAGNVQLQAPNQGLRINDFVAPAQPMSTNFGNATGVTQTPGNRGTVLGVPVDNFSALAGGIGSAIAKPNSWQDKLGTLAKGLGSVQMQKMAAEQQLKGNMNMIQEMAKKDPEFAKQLMARFAAEGTPVPPVAQASVTGSTGGI